MVEEIFISPQDNSGDAQEQINALRAQLTMLQRTLDGMRRENIIDASGREFTVMAHRGPFVSSGGLPLSPYFRVVDGVLRGHVSPHGFLSANAKDIFLPVVPRLGGKLITDDPAPFMPLTPGKYHLVLKTAGGRGFLDFMLGDAPPTRDLQNPNDWLVLAKFTVVETSVKDLETFITVPQTQVNYLPQFTPLLYTDDGENWQCDTVEGFVWPMATEAYPLKINAFQGTVNVGDKLYVKIYTNTDNFPTAGEVTKNIGEPAIIAKPALEDQAANAGIYYIEVCEFMKTDEDEGRFSLWAKITHHGPIVWHMMSFKNVGDGVGNIFKNYETPRTLAAKSLKNVGGATEIVKASTGLDHVPFRTIKGTEDSLSATVGTYADQLTETIEIKTLGASVNISSSFFNIKTVNGLVETASAGAAASGWWGTETDEFFTNIGDTSPYIAIERKYENGILVRVKYQGPGGTLDTVTGTQATPGTVNYATFATP
jgi:hypothetical protein